MELASVEEKAQNLNYFSKCPDSFDAKTAVRLMFTYVKILNYFVNCS